MRLLRLRIAAVSAAATALPSNAGADEAAGAFCAELKTVVAAAQERPAFRSMPADVEVPALGFQRCLVIDLFEPTFICVEDFTDAAARWSSLREWISDCLPGALPYRPRGASPPRADEQVARLRHGDAAILIHEAGYANLPQRYVALHVEAVPRRERRRR